MKAAGFSHGGLPEEARRKITAKLLSGRHSAARLQILLQSATATDHERRTLSTEILGSFNEAISFLESAGDDFSCPDYSLCSDLDSGDSRRSTAVKNNLGRANKRRKSMNTRIVTAVTTEDGRAWRKYGQKVIHNTTYPRSYFRCTHKFDQGCRATKHVQRMEGTDDSKIMYKITYISDHTCGPASPIALSDVATASDSYNLISFSNSTNGQLTEGTGHSFFWRSDDDAAKVGETATTSGLTDHEVDLWSDLKDFGNLPTTTMTTTTTNQYYYSTGEDDADSLVFWDDCLL